jgi:hypothetical protein
MSDTTSQSSSIPIGITSSSNSVKADGRPDHGSKKEIELRIRKSNSPAGDKCFSEQMVKEILRLWCKVCNSIVVTNNP